MPELPEIELYLHALRSRLEGAVLHAVRLGSPFLLRTVDPPVEEMVGRRLTGLRRLGKRIVFELEEERYLILHLMIAGRLHWKDRPASTAPRQVMAAFDWDRGCLALTEAGSKRRATLHLARGADVLRHHDPGGLEVLDADPTAFAAALRRENRTLKRALTDPRLFSGIGNAYSDEILHRARLSPVRLTRQLSGEEVERLRAAVTACLAEWSDRLIREGGDRFPEKLTAFQPGMAVHGRYGLPCPECAAPVQRIRYAENECNYCPNCQNGGRLLADRALSRLLGRDWPRTLTELEERAASGVQSSGK